jgi:hypothetical protein
MMFDAFSYVLATAPTGPCKFCGEDSGGFAEWTDNVQDEKGLITMYAVCGNCWWKMQDEKKQDE